MNPLLRLSILLLLTLVIPRAFAGPDNEKCKQSSEQHKNACQQAANAANGANNAAAGQLASTAGTAIKPNASASKQVNQDAANRLNGAKDQCEKEKEQCEKDCDDAKKSADQKVQQGQSQKPPCSQSPCPEAKQDQSQIPQTKQNACIAPILAMMGPLGQGANDAQNAANGDGNTAGQSGGMPPIPPIPPPQDKQSPPTTPTPTPPPAPDKMACNTSDPSAPTSAACTKDMVAKCTPGLSIANAASQPDSSCDQFTAHYCNSSSTSGSTPFPTMVDTTPTTNGTSRQGSGVGTPFCNTVVARNFCQDPARSQCATCQNYRNQNSDACKTDPSSCPAVSSGSCPVAEPPIAGLPSGTTKDTFAGGGGSSGGGGGSDTFASSAKTASLAPANKEGAQAGYSGIKMDMAVSEGGGSGTDAGSWGGGSEDSFVAKFRKGSSGVNMKAASSGGFRSTASLSPDGQTGIQNGPSGFGLITAQIQRLCSRNQLKNCSPQFGK